MVPGESAAKSILYNRVHCTFSAWLPVKEGGSLSAPEFMLPVLQTSHSGRDSRLINSDRMVTREPLCSQPVLVERCYPA